MLSIALLDLHTIIDTSFLLKKAIQKCEEKFSSASFYNIVQIRFGILGWYQAGWVSLAPKLSDGGDNALRKAASSEKF